MKKRDLIDVLIRESRAANTRYFNLSGGSWISDYGAESFLVCHLLSKLVSQARKSNPQACGSMEEAFTNIAEYSEASSTPGRIPEVLDGNYRADLVLWSGVEKVYGVVEAKRKWDAGLCYDDLARLEALMHRYGKNKGGSVEFACFVCFITRAHDQDGEKVLELYDHIKEYISSNGFSDYRFHTCDPWSYKYKDSSHDSNYSAGVAVVEFY